jgi:copper resistance protein B
MRRVNSTRIFLSTWALLSCTTADAQQHRSDTASDLESTRESQTSPASAAAESTYHPAKESSPPLAEGMTLDAVLDAAAAKPPDSWPEPVGDNPILSFTLLEQLEYRVSDDDRDQFGWEAQGWIGNDNHKFWWKTEGAVLFNGTDGRDRIANMDEGEREPATDEGESEFEALYAVPFNPFWTAQVGVRYENERTEDDTTERASLVLGVQGLAPYKFDLEPTLYLTEDGDLLGRLTASYDLYLTQRLVIQPRTEINLSAQDVPDYGLGAGFNDLTLELRLRYELQREFAPYVGLRYITLLGETADIARQDGIGVDDFQVVFGLRIAF